MDNNKLIIKLTHSQTGRPTYINVDKVTGVRENTEGRTLVLTGDSGQYVEETVEEVLLALGNCGFEVI